MLSSFFVLKIAVRTLKRKRTVARGVPQFCATAARLKHARRCNALKLRQRRALQRRRLMGQARGSLVGSLVHRAGGARRRAVRRSCVFFGGVFLGWFSFVVALLFRRVVAVAWGAVRFVCGCCLSVASVLFGAVFARAGVSCGGGFCGGVAAFAVARRCPSSCVLVVVAAGGLASVVGACRVFFRVAVPVGAFGGGSGWCASVALAGLLVGSSCPCRCGFRLLLTGAPRFFGLVGFGRRARFFGEIFFGKSQENFGTPAKFSASV